MSKHPAGSSELQCAHVGGAGSVLLLLHGLTATWEIWKPVLSRLENQHRVVAITLPGHAGGARVDGPDVSIAGLADQLAGWLAGQGIVRAHVVGNSLGGWLALELARRGVARSVVALSPAGGWNRSEDFVRIARDFRLAYWLVLLLLMMVPLLWIPALRRVLARQTMERADRIPALDFVRSLMHLLRTTALFPLLRSMGRVGAIMPLATEVPVLIAWSGKDRVIPFDRFGERFRACVPQARFTTISGVGHVPMYDNPDAVADCILGVTTAIDARSGA